MGPWWRPDPVEVERVNAALTAHYRRKLIERAHKDIGLKVWHPLETYWAQWHVTWEESDRCIILRYDSEDAMMADLIKRFGTRITSPRWPIATGGVTPMPSRPGSTWRISLLCPAAASSARVVHRWPDGGTH